MTATEKTTAPVTEVKAIATTPAPAQGSVTTVPPATPADAVVAAPVAKKVVAKRVTKKPATALTSAVKVTAKTAVKTTPQAAPKAAAKPAAKAVTKAAAKPAVKSVPKAVAKPVVKPVAKPKAEKSVKAKKPKLVRDSFTIPKAEYTVIDDLKQRAGKLANSVKKSELIRAGIKALAAMTDAAFLAAVKVVPTIKTGRPSKTKSD
jgi:hypothetical protein